MSKGKKKKISTKIFKGKRVNGILYLDNGVGLGRFSRINSPTSRIEEFGNSQIIEDCRNVKERY